MSLTFDTQFKAEHEKPVEVAPGVLRLTADNPGPFTFEGTNSYIVGRDGLAVIDPGPDDEAHFRALLAAIGGRPLSHIFVSHTHVDHSPLAARLKAATGALVCAEGPHRPARPLRIGEQNPLDASADAAFAPDLRLADDQLVEGDGWAVRAIHTPGHTANHVAFALEDSGVLFSADHVMAWATSIIAPPDGSVADFMTSLDRLLERDDRLYLPGHGGALGDPLPFVRGLRTHRKMRERAILERLKSGDRTIPEMVRSIYRDTDPRLHGAAGLSVLAHLEDLVARSLVTAEPEVSIDAEFRPA
jgi:glyoxylase-like metal-dependent hydrolase (beta-lactamase superfamily II)